MSYRKDYQAQALAKRHRRIATACGVTVAGLKCLTSAAATIRPRVIGGNQRLKLIEQGLLTDGGPDHRDFGAITEEGRQVLARARRMGW